MNKLGKIIGTILVIPWFFWFIATREPHVRTSPIIGDRPYGVNTMFCPTSSEGARLCVMPDRDLVMLSMPAARARMEHIWKKQDTPRKILQILEKGEGKGWGEHVSVRTPDTLNSRYDFLTFPELEVDCMRRYATLDCWEWEESPFAKEREEFLSAEK